jgi:hypothetical protein
MDDMYIMVHPEHLKETMDSVKCNLAKIGLHLNEDKTTVWHPEQSVREQLKQHGYPITDNPTVLKTTTLPIPVIPAPTASQGTLIAQHGPEHLAVHRRRMKAAEGIMQLQNAGLNHHTAQSLWRTYTASDATFLARTTDAQEVAIAGEFGLQPGHGRQLLPQLDGHDGFYYAKLIKRPQVL